MTISIKKFMGYRGWKVWMSYDMHISLLALFYILIVDNNLRHFNSLILISSIGFYFMYGFLVNDFFDKPYDITAGKKNAIQELSNFNFIMIIFIVIFISILHLIYIKDIKFIIIYIISYLLATFYSAPPIRFKSRGLSGIIVAGLIEKMLPVFAIFAFFNHFKFDTLIFLAVSFSIEIVEIIGHQIYDYESDLKSGVYTFVVNVGKTKILNIYQNMILPFSVVIIGFLLLLFNKIPYTNIIAISVILMYTVVFVLISKGIIDRKEKVLPLYMSCLFFLILNAFPVFFALFLSIESISNFPLLLFAILSQYYVFKYRIVSIKNRIIPGKVNVFVDT